MKKKPFNRFPQDFTILQGRRPKKYSFSRVIWDGETLRVFNERSGAVEKVYEAEVNDFVTYTSTGSRWTDPDSGLQFSCVKSSGCGCKYNKLSLAKTADPEA